VTQTKQPPEIPGQFILNGEDGTQAPPSQEDLAIFLSPLHPLFSHKLLKLIVLDWLGCFDAAELVYG